MRESLRVAPLCAKLRENRLTWFGKVKKKAVDSTVKMVESLKEKGYKDGDST